MARIPSVEDLGARPVPGGGGRVVSIGGPVVEQGEQHLAGAISGLAEDMLERRDRLQYAQAKSFMGRFDAKLMTDFQTDTDYQSYVDRYEEQMREVQQEALDGIQSGRLREEFQVETETLIASGTLRAQKMALAREVDDGRARLANELVENRKSFLAAPDAATRGLLLESVHDAIDVALQNSYIDEQEAQSMRVDAATDFATGAINSMSPLDRIETLLDPEGTIVSNLPDDLRQGLLEDAVSDLSALEREQRARENHAFQLEQRELRQLEDETAKDGDRLVATGELTVDWIEENRDGLSDEDYRYFYRALTGGSETTDVIVYSDLRQRAADGEDVSLHARDALRRGLMTISDYDKLIRRSEENRGISSFPNWFQRGEDHIKTALRVSDVNPDPGAAQRQASALDDWQQWTLDNPEATQGQAREEYRRVVREWRLLDWEQMQLSMRIPRYSPTTNRMSIGGSELQETIQATADALERGEIGQDEFNEQAVLIERWLEAEERSRSHMVEDGSDG